MIDAIKKALLAGVGAAAITTEKAEKVLNDLVEKGKISATEARDAARKLAEEGKREFEEASRGLEAKFDEVMSSRSKRTAERVATLEAKVAVLESRIAELERDRVASDFPKP